jgi:hypothetical protein
MSIIKNIDCSIVINSLGLFLDITGFIGLFFHKIKRIQLVNTNFLSRVRLEQSTIERTTNDIFESLERSFNEFYKKNKFLDKHSWPFFVLIILGFLFQFISQFL